ncbi:MAG: MBOAT family protein [Burkholderiaceae bacterium]
MVFSSPAFLFYFLPATIAVYYLLRGTRAHNSWLLACSVLFYYLGGGYFTAVLFFSIALNFQFGLWAERTRGTARGKQVVAGAVISNIAILGYFKYANFFVDQANVLRLAAGMPAMEWTAIALPIGVSFYSFHAMSYVIDIARGPSAAKRNPVDFALYVTLFPQLIAGPIVRYHLVERQLSQRQETIAGFVDGAVRFSWGLAKKVLIADQAGAIAEAAFGAPSGTAWSGGTAWLGVAAYTVQIYFDFSAYSDMAIGLARMFGFRFPENFNRPYSAVSVTDFWRRWHMTLSNWFRDYLYIPLGGSRGTRMASYRNLAIVFFLTGLWHGAAWTFIAWGVYHGALLMIERATGLRDLPDGRLPYIRRAVTLLLVMIGWTFFRADDMREAMNVFQAMASFTGALDAKVAAAASHQALFALAVGLASCLLPPGFVAGRVLEAAPQGIAPRVFRIFVLAVLLPLSLAYAMLQDFSPFLYYQF